MSQQITQPSINNKNSICPSKSGSQSTCVIKHIKTDEALTMSHQHYCWIVAWRKGLAALHRPINMQVLFGQGCTHLGELRINIKCCIWTEVNCPTMLCTFSNMASTSETSSCTDAGAPWNWLPDMAASGAASSNTRCVRNDSNCQNMYQQFNFADCFKHSCPSLFISLKIKKQ